MRRPPPSTQIGRARAAVRPLARPGRGSHAGSRLAGRDLTRDPRPGRPDVARGAAVAVVRAPPGTGASGAAVRQGGRVTAPDRSTGPVIRPYRPSDREGVYDVCVRTADAGGDATGQYSTDDFMPDVFAGPYLELEPELAFVVEDGGRVVGYVLGTADTARWAAEHRARWLPRMAQRYPRAAEPRTTQDHLTELLHHPEDNVHPELADHPAHLHIDLLPSHQGQGLGRALIRTYLAALRERGVTGVHLGMSPANTTARAFYDRLGFVERHVEGATDVVFLVAPTDLDV